MTNIQTGQRKKKMETILLENIQVKLKTIISWIWAFQVLCWLKMVFICKPWVHAKSLQPCLTLCNPMDCSLPTPLPMQFSRHEYWTGLPCPSPGDLPDLGIQPVSPALAERQLEPQEAQESMALLKSQSDSDIMLSWALFVGEDWWISSYYYKNFWLSPTHADEELSSVFF